MAACEPVQDQYLGLRVTYLCLHLSCVLDHVLPEQPVLGPVPPKPAKRACEGGLLGLNGQLGGRMGYG